MINKETSKFYSEIQVRLEGVRKKEHSLALVHGVMAVILIMIILLLLVSLVEGILAFDTLGRSILFTITLLGITGSTGWFIVRPLLYVFGLLKSVENRTLALKVGKHFPDVKDRLLDAIQIYEGKDELRQHYSLALIDASFSDLYRQIKPLNFSDAVSDYKVRKMRKFTAYTFGIFLLMFVIIPSGFFGSLYRIINFNKTFAAPLPVQFLIEPGNVEVIRGQDVPITIRTQGKPINNLSFFTRLHGQLEFESQNLNNFDDGIFKTTINNIKNTTDYYASVDEIKSEKYTINVLDRPLIRSMQLKITPPSYTHIPQKLLDENMGDIDAYPGSKVEFDLLSSKALSSATVVFNDSTTLLLKPTGVSANGSFSIRKNVTYHHLLKDKDGLPNLDPVEYNIKVIPDEYPSIAILSPGKNIDLTEEMKLDLFIRIKDDFGFSSLRLAYRLAQSRYERPAEEFTYVDIQLTKKDQSQIDTWYQWDLSNLHLVPEDVIAFYAEVFDNDNVNGPKSGRSEIYIVRLPSLEEVFADVSQSHDQSMESMQNVAKEAQQLKQDVEELHREMKKNREKTDWQQQKKAEEMLKRHDAMKKKLEETTQKLDEMVNKMEENKLLSSETLEKYQELQKLMEQLNAPELREALKKLQESMKQISPEQMKQAMEQLKFTEEQFRKSLERTIELLKRIHIEQKLDELIKRTEELMKQQEALKQQTSKTNPSDQQKRDELAKQQEDLQKQMDSLEKETSDLKEKMEEFPKEMPLDEMKKAEQQLQQNQIGKKMKKSSQQMQSGDMPEAQQSQKKAQEDLNDFKDQLTEAQKALRSEQMKQIVNEMRRQVENMLELSKREEALKDDTKNLNPNSQRFRENAQKQNEVIGDLNNVAEAVGKLSMKTFAVSPEMAKEIGNAMRQMGDAMQHIQNRNPGGSSQKQGEAMGSLNRAAMMMQGALNSMMQGKQCSGMGMTGLMSMLQQLAGKQGGIIAGTQQAMGQGEKISPQQQAEYQRLGAQQGAVQKSLEEIAREAKNTGEYSRLLGDLDKIAQEMQEVQTDLQQGNVNPNTLQKQERILSRLLESARSMRERDYEKRRQAETGKNILRSSPADIDLSTQEGKNKLREELLKMLEGKYTKDYEELIKKYFEQLEKDEIRQ